MKLAIMQPYFFPYIGYFSLIKHTDEFILFDTAQYIRHGWIDRNRILKQTNDWQYINVPLTKHSLETKIKDVKINNQENWKEKIFKQLLHYKKKSPFYNETINVLSQGLQIETDSIVELNANTLRCVCEYLGINFNYKIYTEMDSKIQKVNAPDEWALNICKAIGNVEEYWNPPGGMEFFDRSKYEDAGVKLYFQKVNIKPYPQRRGPENIITGLSMLDVMMFNSIEDINKMLDNFILE